MKLRNLLLTAPFVAISLPALAQDMTIDTDGDGNFSYPELQAVMPDMPTETFTAMDANGDGLLDADEIAVAMEAGQLPAQDG